MKSIIEFCNASSLDPLNHYEVRYDTLLKSFEYETLLEVKDKDSECQGDSRILFFDGILYGILIFGWGSCPGCDALQDCQSWAELAQLQKDLHSAIIWGTKEETLHYLHNHDWEGDYSYHFEETRDFVCQAISLLAGRNFERLLLLRKPLGATYDSRHDVLYVRFRYSEFSWDDEDYPGIIVMRDDTTEVINGLTILDYSVQAKFVESLFPGFDWPEISKMAKVEQPS